MKLSIATGLALVLAAAATSAGATTKLVTGFESKTLAVGDYGYSADETGQWFATANTPNVTGVTFKNMSGVQSNAVPWGFPAAPEGVTTAFLQSYQGFTPGSVDVSLSQFSLVAGQTYTISFQAAGRPGSGGSGFSVSGGAGSPKSYAAPGTGNFSTKTFKFVALASGQSSLNDLIFKADALSGGALDLSTAIDNVGIAVPEPATWAMMLIGFGGLGAVLRGNRRRVLAAA